MADIAMESDGKAAVGSVVQRRLGRYDVNFCDVGFPIPPNKNVGFSGKKDHSAPHHPTLKYPR